MSSTSTFTCEHCIPLLFEVVEGRISEADKRAVDTHLDDCPECSSALAHLWELEAMATRWQVQSTPRWNRRSLFFGPRTWLPGIQVASAFASVVVMVLVLAQVQVSTANGLEIRFGDQEPLATQVAALREEITREVLSQQQGQLKASVDRLTAQQVASDQLVLQAALRATRSERKEDITNLLVLLEEAQDQRYQQTTASLRYLAENQHEDRQDINQLGTALRLVASTGGTL